MNIIKTTFAILTLSVFGCNQKCDCYTVNEIKSSATNNEWIETLRVPRLDVPCKEFESPSIDAPNEDSFFDETDQITVFTRIYFDCTPL